MARHSPQDGNDQWHISDIYVVQLEWDHQEKEELNVYISDYKSREASTSVEAVAVTSHISKQHERFKRDKRCRCLSRSVLFDETSPDQNTSEELISMVFGWQPYKRRGPINLSFRSANTHAVDATLVMNNVPSTHSRWMESMPLINIILGWVSPFTLHNNWQYVLFFRLDLRTWSTLS